MAGLSWTCQGIRSYTVRFCLGQDVLACWERGVFLTPGLYSRTLVYVLGKNFVDVGIGSA